jgi:galactose-1-phosphate uridylyltransferase
MVGYELLAETQKDFIPEDAAAQLRVAILKDVSPEVGGRILLSAGAAG